MIFAATPLAEALGGILAHGMNIGSERWQKGRILSEMDIESAESAGVATLTIARLAAEDVPEDVAAATLAAALASANIIALPAAHGRANLAARSAGILQFDPAMVAAINCIDEALTLATLPALARVEPGEIVATVKIIRYAVDSKTLSAATKHAMPLGLSLFRRLRVVLIATSLPGLTEKTINKTERVTRARVEALGCEFLSTAVVPHSESELATAISAAAADVILVAGASATVDRGDVIPMAIVKSGGIVDRLGMPVDPGNLLVLGRLGSRPVIGLPGCARSPKRNGFDIVLERLVAGLTVSSADIAMMGAGGLLPETERPQPRAAAAAEAKGTTGAIILAAGRSTRMQGIHKLLAPWRGKPLVAHVADAVRDAGLPPPLVVLGARADEVRAALSGHDAEFVEARDYAEGLAHSLRAGLSAAPADWTAALICLGDMPRITPDSLAILAGTPGIAVPTWQGKRGNPVRWPRAHFAKLMTLSGDVGGKALLADLAEEITEVPMASDAVLDDIDTLAALDALRAL
jgi:molybdenum cofactor cytidylyltransferase